jgi:hypothetical protein
VSGNDLSQTIYPNSQRIKILTLTLEVPDCPDFLTYSPGSFDALERVDLGFGGVPSFPAVKSTVLEDACSLRSVTFDVRGYPGVTYLAFHNLRIPWAQLTQVFLRNVHVSVSTAHLMLSQCKSVVNCAVLVSVENDPGPPQLQCNSIVVPNLEDLDVYCMDGTSPEFLQPLVMPSVKELLFTDSLSWPGAALLSFIRRSCCSFEQWQSHTEIPLDDLEALLPELSSVTSIMINPEGGIPIPTIDKIGEGKLLPRIKHFRCSVTLENVKPLLDMVDTRWFDCDSESPGRGLTSAAIHVNYDDVDVDNLYAQVEILQEHYESEGKAITVEVGGL